MSSDHWARRVYLYIATLVGLVLMVVGAVQLINLGLKTWVFPQADQNYYDQPMVAPVTNPDGTVVKGAVETEQTVKNREVAQQKNTDARRQNQAAMAVALIIVGIPLYWYHWHLVWRERGEKV